MKRALSRLPYSYRVPLILYTVEGFSTDEIATMVETSNGTIKVRILRAREMFQTVYEEGAA